MADLMTGVFDYSRLETQYKNFTTPAVSFTLGGKDLVKQGAALLSVEAVLSLDSASSVSVRFGDCYDVKNGSFDSSLKNAAVLGKTAELSLGYQSSLQKVFKGYLSNVRMEASADSGFTMEFVALDARRLMMADNHHSRHYKVKKYSDAVSEILKRYTKLGIAKVDATDENFEDGLLWQNGSDYDFITKDLIGSGKTDREFFVAVDTIYFRKPRSVTSPVLTLRPGGGLVAFERDAAYLDRKFHVLGFDPKDGKAVSGGAEAKSKDTTTGALGSAGDWFIMDPSCVSASEAKKRASALASHALWESEQARIRCIGLPEILPGRFLSIDRVDSSVNKKYYITRVTHTFDEAGFVTSLDVRGWE